jgi:phosphomethylpyrimidine synthase
MRITEDVRAYAKDHGVAEGDALAHGLAAKAAEYRAAAAGGTAPTPPGGAAPTVH